MLIDIFLFLGSFNLFTVPGIIRPILVQNFIQFSYLIHPGLLKQVSRPTPLTTRESLNTFPTELCFADLREVTRMAGRNALRIA
jgi:hypothetical protein